MQIFYFILKMKENGKQNTILRFSFVQNENARLNEFFKEINLSKFNMKFYFKNSNIEEPPINDNDDSFDEMEKKIYVDTSESNDIKFDVELDENNILKGK